jgi:hypothetical protein
MKRSDGWCTKGQTLAAALFSFSTGLPAAWANDAPLPVPAPSVSPAPAPAPAPAGSAAPSPYPSPYPYPYPPSYGFRPYPAPDLASLPDVIDYNEGTPIPPGYKYVERDRKRLVISGSIIFSVMYGVTLMGAIASAIDVDSEYLPMFIPLIGPFVTAGNAQHMDGIWKFFLVTDGLAQVTGAALLVAGLAWSEKVLVRDKTLQTSLAPELLVGPGSVGMRLRF